MNKQFECRRSNVVVPCDTTPTKDNYIIDVWVYDDSLSKEFKTSHYDPTFSYVAFVTFRNNRETDINWNIKPAYTFSELGEEKWYDAWNDIDEYMAQHSKEIIDIATQYFLLNYKNKYLL